VRYSREDPDHLKQSSDSRFRVDSPDGRRIVSFGTNGGVRLWDSEGRQELLTLTPNGSQVVAFSPDGRMILAAVGDTVLVWDGSGWDGAAEEAFQTSLARRREDWHRVEARYAEAAGEWFTAEFHLGRVLQTAPGHPVVRQRRAAACLELGLYDRAGANLDALLQLKQDDASVWLQRSLVQLLRDRLTEALNDLARAEKLAPRDEAIALARHLVLMEAKEPERAAAELSRLRPTVPRISQDFTAEPNFRSVSAACSHILRARPQCWWCWRAHRLIQARAGQWKEALAEWDRTAAAKPHDLVTRRWQVLANSRLDRWQQAAEAQAHVVEL
jgi:tetratricopeptide (TPR) repeat protein